MEGGRWRSRSASRTASSSANGGNRQRHRRRGHNGGHRPCQAADVRATGRMARARHEPEGRAVASRSADGHVGVRVTRASSPPKSARAMSAGRHGVDAGHGRGSRSARGKAGGCRRQRSAPATAHVLFASGDAWRTGTSHTGTRRASRPDHDAAIHAPHPGCD